MPPKVAFELGPIHVRWYGMTMAGGWLTSVEARRKGDDPDYVWQAVPVLMITGVAPTTALSNSPGGHDSPASLLALNPLL